MRGLVVTGLVALGALAGPAAASATAPAVYSPQNPPQLEYVCNEAQSSWKGQAYVSSDDPNPPARRNNSNRNMPGRSRKRSGRGGGELARRSRSAAATRRRRCSCDPGSDVSKGRRRAGPSSSPRPVGQRGPGAVPPPTPYDPRMPRGVAWLTGLLLAIAIGPGAAHAAVVLNEVNCEATDWVELVDPSDGPVDLYGWLLTDDPLDGTRTDHRLVFPAERRSPGRATCCSGRARRLPVRREVRRGHDPPADPGGAVVDEVAVPGPASAPPGHAWGRYPNGTGDWRATLASRGTPNAPSSGGGGPPADAAAWLFEPAGDGRGGSTWASRTRPATSSPRSRTSTSRARSRSRPHGGTYGPYDVGVRLKGGAGSFRPLSGKAAFKVSFNEVVPGQRFLGLRRLTLNNMVQDHSMVHETLAYELFRAAEVPAPRTGHAFVRVNGEAYGVYLNLETLDEVALPRWFPTTRHLYEGGLEVDVWEDALDAFEVDEGDEDDRSDLAALSAAAGTEPFSSSISAVADLDELTRMWAVERYIGHWDGYGGSSGPQQLLPAQRRGRPVQHAAVGDRPDLRGAHVVRRRRRPPVLAVRPQGGMPRALTARRWCSSARGSARSTSRGARRRSPRRSIRQALDPRRDQSLVDIANAVADTKAFLAERPLDAERWLASEVPVHAAARPAPAAPPPAFPAPPAGAAAGTPPSPGRRPCASARTRVGRTSLTTTVRVPRTGRLTQRAASAAARAPRPSARPACPPRRSRIRRRALQARPHRAAPARRGHAARADHHAVGAAATRSRSRACSSSVGARSSR